MGRKTTTFNIGDFVVAPRSGQTGIKISGKSLPRWTGRSDEKMSSAGTHTGKLLDPTKADKLVKVEP